MDMAVELAGRSGSVFELIGVMLMLGGLAVSLVLGARDLVVRRADAVKAFRNRLGQTILLGLEVLVAADILNTIIESPTAYDVLVLGGVVLVRTFLSFTLHAELEGCWPWQTKGRQGAR